MTREEACKVIYDRFEIMDYCESAKLEEALDIAIKALEQSERKKGHWVEIGDEPYDEWECDMCGFVIDGSGCIDPEEYKDAYKFCPNCGADMREGDAE